MEQLINKRLERLIPFLRGFMYDHKDLYVRLNVMIPITWSYRSLVEKGLVLEIQPSPNNSSYLITMGLDPKKSTDQPIDVFLDDFEEVITFNKKEEKKQKLLQQKIRELSKMSLEDIEKIDLPALDLEEQEELNNIVPFQLPPFITPVINKQEEKPIEFTPLYQSTQPNNLEAPIRPSRPVRPVTPDGIEYNEFDDSKLASLHPDTQAQTYNGIPFAPKEMFINQREPDEPLEDIGNGIAYKPLPDLLDNMKNNL